MREATALKELLVYQQTGRFEDQRYKMRLEARLEDMLRSHQAEYDRVVEELDEAREACVLPLLHLRSFAVHLRGVRVVVTSVTPSCGRNSFDLDG